MNISSKLQWNLIYHFYLWGFWCACLWFWWYWTFPTHLLDICRSYFKKAMQVFCPFFIWVICFLVLSFFYIWVITPLSNIELAMSFCHPVGFHFGLLVASFVEQKLFGTHNLICLCLISSLVLLGSYLREKIQGLDEY